LDGIPNLHTIGRNGVHKYNNQDHSMYAAMLTVENMQGAAHDVWAVNTDYEYHEELRLKGQPRSGACPVTTAGGRATRRDSSNRICAGTFLLTDDQTRDEVPPS
jgi:hypothetical protein